MALRKLSSLTPWEMAEYMREIGSNPLNLGM